MSELAWYTLTMPSLRPYNSSSGFTLTEILVVIVIISILALIGVANFSDTSASARDAERQTDLKNLQNALETYKNRVGRYPAGCNSNANWSGQLGTSYECSTTRGAELSTNGTGQYIIGLAPEYISVLPSDSKLKGLNSGYVYRTNIEGTVFKLKAYNTVESEVVTRYHPLKPCDVKVDQNPPPTGAPSTVTNRDPRVIGWCSAISDGTIFTYPQTDCNHNSVFFSSTYAVWGGIAPLYDGGGNAYGLNVYAADPLEQISGNAGQQNIRRFSAITNTTDVICK